MVVELDGVASIGCPGRGQLGRRWGPRWRVLGPTEGHAVSRFHSSYRGGKTKDGQRQSYTW